eukprot:15340634-Ditylum_brightwellii.AAC.1
MAVYASRWDQDGGAGSGAGTKLYASLSKASNNSSPKKFTHFPWEIIVHGFFVNARVGQNAGLFGFQ